MPYQFDRFNEFDHFRCRLYKYLNLVADAFYHDGVHSCHSEALGQPEFDLANTGTAPRALEVFPWHTRNTLGPESF